MPDLFSYVAEPPQRRIDITISRLHDVYETLTSDQQSELRRQPGWAAVEVVLAVRAMERGDGGTDLADAYDRVVAPGGNALGALVATFRETYGVAANA